MEGGEGREEEGEREGGGEGRGEMGRETEKHHFLVPLIYAFTGDSYMGPDQESNPQPWHIETLL